MLVFLKKYEIKSVFYKNKLIIDKSFFKLKRGLIMNFFERVIHSLEGTMETPTNYGWFHIMFLAIAVTATVLLCEFFKDCSDKTFRRIVLIAWITMVVLEIYKQLVFSFEYENNTAVWDFQWYAFPYQLCSTPLYVLPFIAFMKDSKFRDALISYISTFSFFGGLAVYFYPNDVFISTIGINIQTMIHHGIQVVFGIFFVVYNRRKLNHKYYVRGIPVFAALCAVAMLLNIVVYHIFMATGCTETFNMFYISPYFDCTLPILSAIYPNVPYIVFALLYILGFSFVATLIYYIEMGIVRFVERIKSKLYDKQQKKTA